MNIDLLCNPKPLRGIHISRWKWNKTLAGALDYEVYIVKFQLSLRNPFLTDNEIVGISSGRWGLKTLKISPAQWLAHSTLRKGCLRYCSTMWLGCQSRRFNCLFWRETRQRILRHEISPYLEVGRGRERDSWRGTRTRAVDDATQQRGSWRLDGRATGQQRAVGGWTAESWRGRTDRGSQHRTPEQRGEAAWDRVQRQWVKMSLIPVALWNFR